MFNIKQNYEYNLYDARRNLFFSTRYKNHIQFSSTENYFYYNSFITSPYTSYIESSSNTLFDKDNFSLYPMAIRYAQPQLGFYVIERPPFKLRIDFSNSKSYLSRKKIKFLEDCEIWVPWTISVISLKTSLLGISPRFSDNFSFALYFNDRPLSSFDDILLNCYLPNTSSSFVCFGQDTNKISELIEKNFFDISSIYNQAFADYFSGWNSDLQPSQFYTSVFNSVLSRIASGKKPPAFSLTKPSEWHYTKVIQNSLKVYSEMSLEETFAHIAECKNDKYAKYFYNSFSQILELHAIDLNSDSFYNKKSSSYSHYSNHYNYYSFLKNKSSNSLSININLLVKILSKDQLTDSQINQLISNPYIISQIYTLLADQYSKDPQDRDCSSLSFSFEDVSLYMNSSEEGSSNVISC